MFDDHVLLEETYDRPEAPQVPQEVYDEGFSEDVQMQAMDQILRYEERLALIPQHATRRCSVVRALRFSSRLLFNFAVRPVRLLFNRPNGKYSWLKQMLSGVASDPRWARGEVRITGKLRICKAARAPRSLPASLWASRDCEVRPPRHPHWRGGPPRAFGVFRSATPANYPAEPLD